MEKTIEQPTAFAELGLGVMRPPLVDPSDKSSIDMVELTAMVDKLIEAGFTYFDTAWMYCYHKSECALNEILVKRYPRDQFRIATKLPLKQIVDEPMSEEIFEKQLEKVGVDYFDSYLLHNFDRTAYNAIGFDLGEWLLAKKRKGLARRIGFSFHDGPEFLSFLLERYPFMDFVQLQINYADWENLGIRSRECVEVAVERGVDVIAMEPVKGGTLAALPSEAEERLRCVAPDRSPAAWALAFVAQVPGVKTVLSGMGSLMQVEENIALFKGMVPFSASERAALDDVASFLRGQASIACTGCNYCAPHCPQNIAIPEVFALYNADLQEIAEKGWSPHSTYYHNMRKGRGLADSCIGCGSCEAQCPQHLPIRDYLKTVVDRFG